MASLDAGGVGVATGISAFYRVVGQNSWIHIVFATREFNSVVISR